MTNRQLVRKLEKIASEIEKLEKTDKNLRSCAFSSYITFDSTKQLRAKHLGLQHEYNALIDASDFLKQNYNKIIIDTYEQNWLLPNNGEFQVLDPLNIDIEKRIRYANSLYPWTIIGETNSYIFYHYNYRFFRKEKASGQVVYFGSGEEQAVIAGKWIYWYVDGSITADKYIYRRTIDGKIVEKIDCLNNEKCYDAWMHQVSKESVSEVAVEGNWAVFTVYSYDIGAYYELCMTDSDGDIVIQKRPHC